MKFVDYFIKSKHQELNKLYYQPLMHRRAFVMNEIDELNIIKKINSQGKTAIDNNEYSRVGKRIK